MLALYSFYLYHRLLHLAMNDPSLSLYEPTLKRFRAALFAHAKGREFGAKIQSGFAVTHDKMDDKQGGEKNIWLAGGCQTHDELSQGAMYWTSGSPMYHTNTLCTITGQQILE